MYLNRIYFLTMKKYDCVLWLKKIEEISYFQCLDEGDYDYSINYNKLRNKYKKKIIIIY